jgi:hypothetical protein
MYPNGALVERGAPHLPPVEHSHPPRIPHRVKLDGHDSDPQRSFGRSELLPLLEQLSALALQFFESLIADSPSKSLVATTLDKLCLLAPSLLNLTLQQL